MEKRERDERLEAFFEHNPLDDDLQYLKQYVRQHPDNKMGWYLLGNEYALRNKEGKARYCYAQAGEVYEAFEHKKVKLGLREEFLAEQTILPGQKSRRGVRRLLLRWTGAALVLLLLLNVAMDGGPIGIYRGSKEAEGPIPSSTEGFTFGTKLLPAPDQNGLPVRIVYTHPLEGKNAGLSWRQDVIDTQAPADPATAAVSGQEGAAASPEPQASVGPTTVAAALIIQGRASSDPRWIDWVQPPLPLLEAFYSSNGGDMLLRHLDSSSCGCTAGKDPQAAPHVKSWVKQEEGWVVLHSAMLAYQKLYSQQLPESIDDLVRDYPNNVLPGYTPAMKEAYPELLKQMKKSGGTAAAGDPARADDSAGSNGKTPDRKSGVVSKKVEIPAALSGPLEIVVDKDQHHLALVSGSIILRSYEVGLGGERTPEGVFTITEKVRHPNGRDDGDFGSRGMQLSDRSYAIHGTNEPSSIGKDESLGCVRMQKEDIEELFDMVPTGTKVTIGKGLLPKETIKPQAAFQLPELRKENQPGKIYHWL